MFKYASVLISCLFLASCSDLTLMRKGNMVTISPCAGYWDIEDNQRTLRINRDANTHTEFIDLWGCDIFTSRTMRDIKNNNDKLRD